MNSFTEENYIKTIYSLSKSNNSNISTSSIAEMLQTKASSVTDMLKKLSNKGLVIYEKYKGVQLTREGEVVAVKIIRKHRLWECFLVDKLNFKWDEVHEMAEQLEHLKAPELVNRLDAFLGHPKYDPHGDPIPDAKGNIEDHTEVVLFEMKNTEKGIVVGVKDSSSDFLKYLDKLKLGIGTEVQVQESFVFDGSKEVVVGGVKNTLSAQVTKNIYVQKC